MSFSRSLLALVALCGLASGQTGLTTIQDTLFQADGTRFNGTLTIQWVTFDAVNLGTVVQQSKSVSVVNGNLYVQLAPDAGAAPPANVYNVTYQSDGYQQYAETWTVPVSARSLTVAEIRTGSTTTSSGSGTTGNDSSQSPIPESDVIGLQADLNQRPAKGAGFGANGVAVVDSNGILETAVGQFGQCVLVDGTTGPCGAPTFVDAETPGGTIDGNNGAFTLANTPSGTSLMLFRNGVYLTNAFDYNLTGSTIQFVAGAIPQPGDTLTASYRVDPSASGSVVPLVIGSPSPVRAPTMAQVICSSTGTSTGLAAWTTLGACDLPAGQLNSGDRIEVRFTFTHTGAASAFSIQLNWGATTILTRSAFAQDAAVVGSADATLTNAGAAEISVESWGTVLPFLPSITNSTAQTNIQIALSAALSNSGSDTVALTNFTVLRYPAN